jgi:hypothetical protein
MKKTIVLFLLLCAFIPMSVHAQETPHVIDTTIPVDGVLRTDINTWLSQSAPAPEIYWAITYVGKPDEDNGDVFVSVVALDIDAPTTKWHITDNTVVTWMGSVIVHADNTVEVYSDGGYAEEQQARRNGVKLAAPKLDGGGSNVRFPWDSGMSMMYGTRGIHEAGGGGQYAQGFSAVDFIGGDDLGASVASNRIYAVANGTVDYVCQDPTTTLVRTANTQTGDYYIYAHLLENVNLTEDYSFYQGDYIGSLKYGTFDDNCGWAEQTAKHYHLHFGFRPANGFFTLEDCTLSMASQEWKCGNNETVKVGQFITNGYGQGSIPTIGDDAGTYSKLINFWDLMLGGASQMWDKFVIANMPDHTTNTFLYALYNGVSVAIRVARVMVYSNINLGHLVAVLVFAMGIKVLFGIAEFVMFLFKAWKSLVPILGA